MDAKSDVSKGSWRKCNSSRSGFAASWFGSHQWNFGSNVIQGEVPLLLPIRMLKMLGAIIDLPRGCMHLCEPNVDVKLHELPSGHVAVDVLDFAHGRFEVPGEAGCAEEFHEHPPQTTAMLAQTKKQNNSKPTLSYQAKSNGEPHDGYAWHFRTDDCPTAPSFPTWGASRRASAEELARNHGQGHHAGDVGGVARRRKGLVSTILGTTALMLGTLQGRNDGGHLCRADCGGTSTQTFEECTGAHGGSQQLHPPEGKLEGWRECIPELHRVQGLPFQMGNTLQSGGDEGRAQDGEPAQEDGPREPNGGGTCAGMDGKHIHSAAAQGSPSAEELGITQSRSNGTQPARTHDAAGDQENGAGNEGHEAGSIREGVAAGEEDASSNEATPAAAEEIKKPPSIRFSIAGCLFVPGIVHSP